MQDKSRTLRRRLAWLVVCVVGLAVTPIAGLSAWHDGERAVALETARLGAAARVIASLAADAAAQRDQQGAFRALRSIGQMPDIEYGRIEGLSGSLLAEAGAGERLVGDVQARGGATFTLSQLFSRSSEVSVPILSDGRPVGRVLLLGRTDGMLARFLASLGESLAVAAAAVLIGLLIAWRLQERIARPILKLRDAMRGVQESCDFAGGVTIAADGEVAELIGGFNRMLSEICLRDGRIAAQLAGLEREVEARTAELVVARDVAEAASSAKAEFLATMSHEIRTPMNGVMAMAEMLAGSALPPRERRYAEVIAKSGASLLAIINDILDFSKMEAGKLELESVAVEPSEIVDDVLSLFWHRAAGKGLELVGFVDPATPRSIAADPVRLRQVISNLVNNAIKFTERGGVLIEIAPHGDAALRIAVQDSGIGIPEDKLGAVFSAFTQADQSTTRRFGGTGLGLAICRKLVDAMGGTLNVTSALGEGSSFALLMPTRFLEPAPPWPRAALPGTAAAVAVAGAFTRRVLTAYLARAGYALAADAAPTVAIVDAATLPALIAPPSRIICLAEDGADAPQALLRQGRVQAVLAQPVRRQELIVLLERLASGAPLLEAADSAGHAPAAGGLPCFMGARVLVADDSAVNREVAMEALRRLGIAATLVADGRAAVAAATRDRFDVVLMDGSMPEMSGYDAAREIRRLAPVTERLPIVALTAHVVGAAAEAWRDAGMDGVLHKPFTLKALAETLGRFLVPQGLAAPRETEPVSPVAAAAAGRGAMLLDPQVTAQLQELAAGGRSDFVEKIIRLYRDNAPPCIHDLVAAARADDPDGVARAAHALKSMSYNVGAMAVAAAAAALEEAGNGRRLPDEGATERLSALLDETLAVLGVGPAAALPQREAVTAD